MKYDEKVHHTLWALSFFFFLIVLPWFGHVFSNKGRFGHKRKLPGFFYFLKLFCYLAGELAPITLPKWLKENNPKSLRWKIPKGQLIRLTFQAELQRRKKGGPPKPTNTSCLESVLCHLLVLLKLPVAPYLSYKYMCCVKIPRVLHIPEVVFPLDRPSISELPAAQQLDNNDVQITSSKRVSFSWRNIDLDFYHLKINIFAFKANKHLQKIRDWNQRNQQCFIFNTIFTC